MDSVFENPVFQRFVDGATARLMSTWMTKERAEHFARQADYDQTRVFALYFEPMEICSDRSAAAVERFAASFTMFDQVAIEAGIDRAELSRIAAQQVIEHCRHSVLQRIMMHIGQRRLAEDPGIQHFLKSAARLILAGGSADEHLDAPLIHEFAEANLQIWNGRYGSDDCLTWTEVRPQIADQLEIHVARERQRQDDLTRKWDQRDAANKTLIEHRNQQRPLERAVIAEAVEVGFDEACSRRVLGLPGPGAIPKPVGSLIEIRAAAVERAKSLVQIHKAEPKEFQPIERPTPSMVRAEHHVEQRLREIFRHSFINAVGVCYGDRNMDATQIAAAVEPLELDRREITERDFDPQDVMKLVGEVHHLAAGAARDYARGLERALDGFDARITAELARVEDRRQVLIGRYGEGEIRWINSDNVPDYQVPLDVLVELAQIEIENVASGRHPAGLFQAQFGLYSPVIREFDERHKEIIDRIGTLNDGENVLSKQTRQDICDTIHHQMAATYGPLIQQHFETLSQTHNTNNHKEFSSCHC